MRHKILVIDDELSIRLMLENFLSRDYDVTCMNDGKSALEWLEGNQPHLVICDIQMPGMDGYECLSKIRQRGYTRHTPVIMLSASDTSKGRVQCYRLGAQDYLIKPFNPEELEELVKKNLFPIHYAVRW
jgi:DNA-binding response OmpR family regulator